MRAKILMLMFFSMLLFAVMSEAVAAPTYGCVPKLAVGPDDITDTSDFQAINMRAGNQPVGGEMLSLDDLFNQKASLSRVQSGFDLAAWSVDLNASQRSIEALSIRYWSLTATETPLFFIGDQFASRSVESSFRGGDHRSVQASPYTEALSDRLTVEVSPRVGPGVQHASAFKTVENKWLWLKPSNTTTVTYRVQVPADAAAGAYTIGGAIRTALPAYEAAANAVTVVVEGAPTQLAVKAITLSQSPVKSSGAAFIAQGAGIASTGENADSRVKFSAASTLANGVYLYVVTAKGADGQSFVSKVQKLVIAH